MSRTYFHIAICSLLCVHTLKAQLDSAHYLREITVNDYRINALQIAQYCYKTDSVNQLMATNQSAAEWLQGSSAVHVRQYAPGSAASFSTRGATSAQSAILWGGFTINSAATSVADLSVLPSTFYTPSLLLGGSASFFGSGAIGGVLNLGNPPLKKGWHGNFSQQVASFNTFQTVINASYSGAKISSSSNFTYGKSSNSYMYVNGYKIPKTEETRQNAAYEQVNFSQLFGYQLTKKSKLEAEIWYNKALRETPNSILINKPAAAVLKDNYLRSRIAWTKATNTYNFNLSYAYLYEWQSFEDSTVLDIYGKSLLDTNITASNILQLNYDLRILKNLKWQSGIQVRHDSVSGSNRSGQQLTSSFRTGVFYQKNKFTASALLRAEIWKGDLLPLSPFASARYEILKHFFASVYGGFNYRIPSLNDRFWVPGGNANLQAENGWTGEGAVFYDKTKNGETFYVRAAYYKSALDNYIQWVPGVAGIWSPQNVKEVSISGVDVNAKYSRQVSKFYFSGEANASYNHAIVRASNLKNDASVGKQLIYQPKYKTTLGATLGYKKCYVHAGYRFTSQVATSYDGSTKYLAAYNLVDASISKSFRLKKVNATVILAANNILGSTYETIPYYPMPLSNFSLTLKISI